jgi:hypothetical protein
MMALALPASAYPTKINNAYNADVTPACALDLHLWGEWGNNKYDDGHFLGASYGIADMAEVGFSWRLTEDEGYRQDPTYDVKLRFDLGEKPETCCADGEGTCEEGCTGCPCRTSTGLAIGADNINFDEDTLGKIIPYIVYTHDFEDMRAHVGYSFEEDNGAIFAGLDFDSGDATLKFDWMQVNDGNDWEAAFGFDMPFQLYDDNWTFTSYLTFASDSDASDVWHAEVSYLIP